MSILEIVEKLNATSEPSRRLDAEIIAVVLGPPGCALDMIEDIDGWGVNCAPDAKGHVTQWMCAADVPYLTRYSDAALELLAETHPHDGGAITMSAMARLMANRGCGAGALEMSGLVAQAVMLELLLTMAANPAETGRRAA